MLQRSTFISSTFLSSTSYITLSLKFTQLLQYRLYVVIQKEQHKSTGKKVAHKLMVKLTPGLRLEICSRNLMKFTSVGKAHTVFFLSPPLFHTHTQSHNHAITHTRTHIFFSLFLVSLSTSYPLQEAKTIPKELKRFFVPKKVSEEKNFLFSFKCDKVKSHYRFPFHLVFQAPMFKHF